MSSFGEGIQMTPLQLGALVSSFANVDALLPAISRTAEERQNFEPRIKRTLNIEALLPKCATACWRQCYMERAAAATSLMTSRHWKDRNMLGFRIEAGLVCFLRESGAP